MSDADIDARTIAADIMCGNARAITPAEVWAHIGQAYDTAEIDASIADEVAELIAKTGIDLIWPDGSKDTELDAARVEIERLRAELERRKEGIDRLIAFRNAKVWESTELVQRVRAARALAEGADGDGDFGSVSASDLLAALGEPHPAESRPAVELTTEHRCPNCAPGYDCEHGIYTPGVAR